MYAAFWLKVTDVINASFFGRIFLIIVNYIGNAFKASWFYKFFTHKDMGNAAENAFIPSFIRKILFKSVLSDIVSQSFFIKTVCKIPENVISSPLTVISCYLIPSTLLIFLRSFGNVPFMIIFAALFLVGIILIRFKITVGALAGSSLFLGKLCEFFNIKTDYPINKKPLKIYIVAAIIGTFAGLVSFVGGNTIMFAAFLGCLMLPFLLDSPLLLISLTVLGGISLSTFPAVALSLLTFLVVICRVFCKKEKLPKFRPVYIVVALYFVLTLYHMFNGFGGSDSMLAAMIHLSLLLLFFSVTIVANSKNIFKKLIFSITACTLYTSIIGIVQFVFGLGGMGWSDNEEYVGGLSRITSTFANPNVYGEFLIITVCISFIAVFLSSNWWQRVFFGVCSGLQLINLALTYSRGCYLAVIFAIILIVWCCDKRLLGFGVFAVPVIPYVLPANMLTRLVSIGSYFTDTSVSYRMSIWKAAIKIVQNHWFIGSGVGTVAFTAFYLDYMIPGVDAQHSHNWFMQITIELSVVALVLMLLILYYSVKDVCFTVKNVKTPECKFVLVSLIAAVCGIFIEGFVDYIFYNNIVYMTFWLLIALLVSALNIFNIKKEK